MVNFYELAANRFVLTDARTLEVLAPHHQALTQKAPQDSSQAQDTANLIYEDERFAHLRRALRFLATAAMFEGAAVDRTALKSLRQTIRPPLDALFHETEIPLTVYQNAGAQIAITLERLTAKEDRSWLQHNDDFYGDEKEWMDHVARELSAAGMMGLPDPLVSSNDSLPRVFVYLEAASKANVPTLLSPGKIGLFERIDELLTPRLRKQLGEATFRRLTEVIDDKATLHLESTASVRASRSMIVPALDAYILRIYCEKKCSLFDAVMSLRSSRDAPAFRQWLWSVHTNLASTNPVDRAFAAKALEEVGKIAEEWAQTCDLGRYVKYRRRELKLDSLPKVGSLLKVLGDLHVNDPILNPPRYLRFISTWFTEHRAEDKPDA